jgi:hypothetical protein
MTLHLNVKLCFHLALYYCKLISEFLLKYFLTIFYVVIFSSAIFESTAKNN